MPLNNWIKESIKLANSDGYLDNLLSLYPLASNQERDLPSDAEQAIKEFVAKKDKVNLIKYLLELEKFPIDTPYTASLRMDSSLIMKNPKTVDILASKLFAMGYDDIIKGSKEPKRASRQIGAVFLNWLSGETGYTQVDEKTFNLTKTTVLLGGSDKTRKDYANNNLGANITEKGIDLLLKKGSKFIMGQAKFITAGGGSQDNQFNEALRFVSGSSTRLAILDGIVWFDKTYLNKIKQNNKNIISALMLKKFCEKL